jgi:AbiV family abortive infection protein
MNEAENVQLFKEASKLSLENAEQWTKDAKLLVDAASLKHAAVLMQFASEEIAKFIVCWHVGEGMMPIKNNRLIKEVFRSHKIKNHILFGFMVNLVQGTPLKEGFRVEDYVRDIKFIEREALFKNMAFYSDKLRQICTHVDIDWKKGKVLTLEYASKPAADNIMNPKIAAERLQGLENTISYMRKILDGGISEQDKNTLREFYESMPKEAWKTGEIPIEWFEKLDEAKEVKN